VIVDPSAKNVVPYLPLPQLNAIKPAVPAAPAASAPGAGK
jgi:hypothetical protein